MKEDYKNKIITLIEKDIVNQKNIIIIKMKV